MKQTSPPKDIAKILSKIVKEHFSYDLEGDHHEISNEQKILLAETFLSRGELQLLKGEIKGIYLFETASKLDPKNAKLFYRQGLSLVEYGGQEGREKALLLACKKFRKALELDPSFFESWHALGSTLVQLGKAYDEYHYFLEADKNLQKAIALCSKQPTDTLIDLYWDHATASLAIGNHTNEALDYQQALTSFQKVSELQANLPYEFWIEYGEAASELGELINNPKLYLKAIECFKQAIGFDPLKDAWYYLAKALSKFYLVTHEEDHFQQASDCFATATRLHPEKAEFWLDWGLFLFDAGKISLHYKKFEMAAEKFKRTLVLDSNESLAQAYLIQSLALLGESEDKLEWIYEAQNQATKLQETADYLPDTWLAEGQCYLSLGTYFQDLDYYYDAISSIQTGLAIDRSRHDLWYALACAFGQIALATVDHEILVRACHFHKKALQLSRTSEYVYGLGWLLSKFGEITQNQTYLEQAAFFLEQANDMQKNVLTLHPDWIFQYASTLDMLGDFFEQESYYTKAIDLLLHLLILHPEFPGLHHRLALAYAHLGDLEEQADPLYRSYQHYRIAARKEDENDIILLDWATTLISLARYSSDVIESEQAYREAEHKLTQAIKLGNYHAYYPLACIYSLRSDYDQALVFLKRAHEAQALPSLEEMLQDEWIDGLRMTSGFKEFLEQIPKKVNLQEES